MNIQLKKEGTIMFNPVLPKREMRFVRRGDDGGALLEVKEPYALKHRKWHTLAIPFSAVKVAGALEAFGWTWQRSRRKAVVPLEGVSRRIEYFLYPMEGHTRHVIKARDVLTGETFLLISHTVTNARSAKGDNYPERMGSWYDDLVRAMEELGFIIVRKN
jgi:hypothetical protein